jgi:signal transduction histidine kinase
MDQRPRRRLIGLLELPGRSVLAPNRAVSAALGALISIAALVRVGLDVRYEVTALTLVAAALAWTGVAVAYRWPLAGLALTFAAVTAFVQLGLPATPLWLGLLVALFWVGLLRPTGEAFAITLGTVALAVIVAAVSETVPFTWEPLSQLGWLFAAGALGSAGRFQRAYAAEATARAVWAERTQEQEARQRVADERLRIARELHDVVGHRIALINIQAGVATQKVESDPTAARAALDHIADAAGGALSEIRGTLGLLRDGPSGDRPDAPATPAGDVNTLVADARAAGLPVELAIEGEPRDLTDVLRSTVYRVVQECLTNVVKHGRDVTTVRVNVRYGQRRLDVSVVNDGAPVQESTGDGRRGLQGMGERVRAVGGDLRAGPEPRGGFAVRAELPLGVMS